MKNLTPDYAEDRTVPPSGGVVVPFNLPPSYTVRWVPRRKANVVAAVEAGILSMTEACFRYRLSPEEFLEWERQYKAGELTRPRSSPKKPALH